MLEIDLFEISLVTFPANEAAQVTVVKSQQDTLGQLMTAIRTAEQCLRIR